MFSFSTRKELMMPPKVTFSQESVVNAAFEIVRDRGFAELSARTVADRLKSSTGPVYTSFASMEELKAAVIGKAEELLNSYALQPYTKSVFLNMGTGIVLFAQENPVLFRSMFMDAAIAVNMFENLKRTVSSHLDNDDLASRLAADDRHDVLHKLAIFVYGYASLVCVGVIQDVNKNTIIKTMLEIGRDVIDSTLGRCSP
jgi:AcrR family transcriptional regulator